MKHKHILCEEWVHDAITKVVKKYKYRGQGVYLEEVLLKDPKFKEFVNVEEKSNG